MSMRGAPNPPAEIEEIVRWGDRQTIFAPVTELNAPKTIQLVKVHRHVPETWTLTLFAFVRDTAAVGPTFDITVSFDLFVGSGSTQINLLPTIRMQSGAAAIVQDYNSLVTTKPVGFLFFQVPANDIQIIVTNVVNNASPAVSVDVAALAAPRFSHPNHEQRAPHTSMPEGFYPEMLQR